MSILILERPIYIAFLAPYDGNLILALAAYNAGEKAVERWQRRYPGLELDEFVESLSFRETRNYVKLVLRNYRTYLRLYGKNRFISLIVSADTSADRAKTAPALTEN